jgi:hypothetical protein
MILNSLKRENYGPALDTEAMSIAQQGALRHPQENNHHPGSSN